MPHHTEEAVLPYGRQALFDLVTRVTDYPHFVPWCIGARVLDHTGDRMTAELLVGNSLVRTSFTSLIDLRPPETVHIHAVDGPLEQLVANWTFEPVEAATRVL